MKMTSSKFQYCCFTFYDETKARIAPISIMRKKDKKSSKYAPVAADDLPAEGVEVQWVDRPESSSGSFSRGGYYPAQPHFNAGEYYEFMFSWRVRDET